jgi:hypothetical protein
MESANIGKYKETNMFLISEGGQYFISFGSPDLHHYWLTALNRILSERPDYKFKVRISEEDEIEVDMQEFAPILEKINELVDVIA